MSRARAASNERRTASSSSISASTTASRPITSLPHGEVCVRSVRSPDKNTPNEDAAAVIQSATDSLVLAVADGVGGMPAGREASNAAVQTLRACSARCRAKRRSCGPRSSTRSRRRIGRARARARRRHDAGRRAARRRAAAQLPRRRFGAAGGGSARPHQAARRAAFADGVCGRGGLARRGRGGAARSAPRAVQRDRLARYARRGRVRRCSSRCATRCCSRATGCSTICSSTRSSTAIRIGPLARGRGSPGRARARADDGRGRGSSTVQARRSHDRAVSTGPRQARAGSCAVARAGTSSRRAS